MTLRLRMVLALLALVTAGLAGFGGVTYSLYARAQYDRLDEQPPASIGPPTGQLTSAAGLGGPPRNIPGVTPSSIAGGGTGGGGGSPGSRPGGPPLVIPPDSYGELRDAKGAV